jgi:hypothetical protein
MEQTMGVRLQISALIFMMVQAVVFGIGTVLVLATPLQKLAMELLPAVVVASFIISAPLSWFIAPRLRARFWLGRARNFDLISGPADAIRE